MTYSDLLCQCTCVYVYKYKHSSVQDKYLCPFMNHAHADCDKKGMQKGDEQREPFFPSKTVGPRSQIKVLLTMRTKIDTMC